MSHEPRACVQCGTSFTPRTATQRYCSRACVCAAMTDGRRIGFCGRSQFMADGLPERAHAQRAVLRCLGMRPAAVADIARRAGMSPMVTRKRLVQLRALRLAESVRVASPDSAHYTFWRRVVPAGRICAHPGCETRLSRYNPLSVCALHAGELSYEEWREVAG